MPIPDELIPKITQPLTGLSDGTLRRPIRPGEGLALDGTDGIELYDLLDRLPTNPTAWENSGVKIEGRLNPYGTVTNEAFATAASDESQAFELGAHMKRAVMNTEHHRAITFRVKLGPWIGSAMRRAWAMEIADPHAVARLSVIGSWLLIADDYWRELDAAISGAHNSMPKRRRADESVFSDHPEAFIATAKLSTYLQLPRSMAARRRSWGKAPLRRIIPPQ